MVISGRQKISIAGKGGTGKSVFTALLGRVLGEEGYRVLILDSDESNPGLYRMLGFHQSPLDLIHLFGGQQRVMELNRDGEAERARGIRGEGFNPDKIFLQDIPGKYLMERDRLKLAAVGKITVAFEGCACPMAEVLKLFLARLTLRDNEVVLMDMEAGVEHFSRGVEKFIDTLLIMVEPSFESIALASKINLLARASGVKNIGAVINKIPSAALHQKMQEEVSKRNMKVVGTIPFDQEISESCLEGKPLAANKSMESVRKISHFLLGISSLAP